MSIAPIETLVLSTPDPVLLQSMDGVPHLSYYRNDEQMSFCWDADPASWIEVSVGGAGEPVYYRISPPADYQPRLFGNHCDRWAEEVLPTLDDE